MTIKICFEIWNDLTFIWLQIRTFTRQTPMHGRFDTPWMYAMPQQYYINISCRYFWEGSQWIIMQTPYCWKPGLTSVHSANSFLNLNFIKCLLLCHLLADSRLWSTSSTWYVFYARFYDECSDSVSQYIWDNLLPQISLVASLGLWLATGSHREKPHRHKENMCRELGTESTDHPTWCSNPGLIVVKQEWHHASQELYNT